MARYRRSKTNPKYFQDIPKRKEKVKKMTSDKTCEQCNRQMRVANNKRICPYCGKYIKSTYETYENLRDFKLKSGAWKKAYKKVK